MAPKSKAVLAPVDPLAARQFQNQRLVQRRLGGGVERIEALGLRKARQPNPALHVAALAIDALQESCLCPRCQRNGALAGDEARGSVVPTVATGR